MEDLLGGNGVLSRNLSLTIFCIAWQAKNISTPLGLDYVFKNVIPPHCCHLIKQLSKEKEESVREVDGGYSLNSSHN